MRAHLDDSCVLCFGSHHESGDIVEENDGCVPGHMSIYLFHSPQGGLNILLVTCANKLGTLGRFGGI